MKARRLLRHLWKSERGTQMIEFAFALPFLLLLFAGVAELGRMFYTYTTLAKATRAGARYASTQLTVAGDDLTHIKNMTVCGYTTGCDGTGQPTAVVSGLSSSNVTVSTRTVSSIQYVSVTITYNYTPLIFDLAAMTGSQSVSLSKTFTPSTEMRFMN